MVAWHMAGLNRSCLAYISNTTGIIIGRRPVALAMRLRAVSRTFELVSSGSLVQFVVELQDFFHLLA